MLVIIIRSLTKTGLLTFLLSWGREETRPCTPAHNNSGLRPVQISPIDLDPSGGRRARDEDTVHH